MYIDTGLEYPEIREFVKTVPNVEWLHPEVWDKHKRKYVRTSFKEVIKTYGYPIISKEQAAFIQEYRDTKSQKVRDIRINGNKYGMGKISKRYIPLIDAPFLISDKCCDIMKKKPAHEYQKQSGRFPITGQMACESRLRKKVWLDYGCNIFEGSRAKSNPISFWVEQDILEYLLKFNIPYCSVYGEIKQDETGRYYTTDEHRTGCVFCGFGCHLEDEPNRFQRLKITHPKLWNYCMKSWGEGGLGMRKVLGYIGVKTE